MHSGVKKTYDYYIGIDPGVKTGFALWSRKDKKMISVGTHAIHFAMGTVKTLLEKSISSPLLIRVEDARKRKWYGKDSNTKQQGAGSIKRDCKIWEDFLTDIGADFEMVAPRKGMTKYSAEAFKKLTGYRGKTSEHSRDAAMLVAFM